MHYSLNSSFVSQFIISVFDLNPFDIAITLIPMCSFSYQYVVREAAKAAGLWEKAPYMEEISTDPSKYYYYGHVR